MKGPIITWNFILNSLVSNWSIWDLSHGCGILNCGIVESAMMIVWICWIYLSQFFVSLILKL